jgi:hypothetical protein
VTSNDHTGSKKECLLGYLLMQTNADENGTRTRATFVTRKYVKITLTWRHNQLGHLTVQVTDRWKILAVLGL